jgi:hypothetical protein
VCGVHGELQRRGLLRRRYHCRPCPDHEH